jgi:hypothetical protein
MIVIVLALLRFLLILIAIAGVSRSLASHFSDAALPMDEALLYVLAPTPYAIAALL